MRTHYNLFALAITAMAVFTLTKAHPQGMLSFHRWLAANPWVANVGVADVGATDRDAMTRARTEVLDKNQPGAVSTWSDAATGRSGEVELRRIYARSGMNCGDVEYILKTPDMQHYDATFCRTGDGSWRALG